MGALRIAVAALALAAASPAAADPVDRWRTYIDEASARFAVPAEWIARVMRAESGGRTTLDGRPIVSRAGAMGLMQLMPGTWAEMRARLGLGNDPYAPRDNILAGTLYLRLMHDRFGYPGLFGAYNAGPGRYGAFVTTGRALPGETRRYLANVSGAAPPVLTQARDTPRERRTPQNGAIFFVLAHGTIVAPSDQGLPRLFIGLHRAADSTPEPSEESSNR